MTIMRRRSSKAKVIKVMTAAAAALAISTGSVFAYAGDFDMIRVDNGTAIEIDRLTSDPAYRALVMHTFMNNGSVLAREEDTQNWLEYSKDVTLENWPATYED